MAILKKGSDGNADDKPGKGTEPAKAEAKPSHRDHAKKPGVLRRIGGYFKGSWQELRQTKWPTRSATWSLTVAVIIFTLFIMLFIIAVDNLFGLLFERLIL